MFGVLSLPIQSSGQGCPDVGAGQTGLGVGGEKVQSLGYTGHHVPGQAHLTGTGWAGENVQLSFMEKDLATEPYETKVIVTRHSPPR